MADWVKCSLVKTGTIVHINRDLVVTIAAVKGGSRIAFAGSKDDYIDVKEAPEKIMGT